MALQIPVPKVFAIPITLASAHGLMDLHRSTRDLAPYLALFLPLPARLNGCIFSMFIAASCFHFQADAGARVSIGGHVLFVVAFMTGGAALPLAWSAFTAFYTLVHARRRAQMWYALAPRHARMATAAGAISALAVSLAPMKHFALTRRAQVLVICHALIEAHSVRATQENSGNGSSHRSRVQSGNV